MNKPAFLFFLFLLISCKQESESNVQADVSIPAGEHIDAKHTLLLSDMIQRIDYIPLETQSDFLIDRMQKFVVDDRSGEFYVSAKNQIHHFSNEGKHIKSIKSIGKGSGEYQGILDFTLNTSSKEIIILDFQKVLIFDVQGNHLHSFLLPLRTQAIGVIKDLIVLNIPSFFYKDSNFVAPILIVNKYGEVIRELKMEYEDNSYQKLVYVTPGYLYNHSNKLYYKDPFLESIYEISDKEFIKSYTINFQGLAMPMRLFTSRDMYRNEYKDYIFIGNILESEKYLFYNYVFGDQKGEQVFDKQSGAVYNSVGDQYKSLIKNDVDGTPFWPQWITEEKVYQLIDPIDYLEIENRKLKNVSPNDNPIIQVATIN